MITFNINTRSCHTSRRSIATLLHKAPEHNSSVYGYDGPSCRMPVYKLLPPTYFRSTGNAIVLFQENRNGHENGLILKLSTCKCFSSVHRSCFRSIITLWLYGCSPIHTRSISTEIYAMPLYKKDSDRSIIYNKSQTKTFYFF